MARPLTLKSALEILMARIALEVVAHSLGSRCGSCGVPPGEWCTPMRLAPHAPRLRMGARATINARLRTEEY